MPHIPNFYFLTKMTRTAMSEDDPLYGNRTPKPILMFLHRFFSKLHFNLVSALNLTGHQNISTTAKSFLTVEALNPAPGAVPSSISRSAQDPVSVEVPNPTPGTAPEIASSAAALVVGEGKAEIAPSVGAYGIWTIDKNGRPVSSTEADGKNIYPDPSNAAAEDIYFGVRTEDGIQVPKEQIDLQVEISKVLETIKCLYLSSNAVKENKFRLYYVRLYNLAQLGLAGKNVYPAIAKSALADLVADLVTDEAGNIKNRHLDQLGNVAAKFSVIFLILYTILRLIPGTQGAHYLEQLGIDIDTSSSFMLLWIGCFIGVWLSYGIRANTFTLNNLVITDADRLTPATRLIFAGLFAMILGLLFILNVIDVSIGNFSVTKIDKQPVLAFLVGAFCGISELALPESVGKRATTFITSVK
jgi:hypothetical protein